MVRLKRLGLPLAALAALAALAGCAPLTSTRTRVAVSPPSDERPYPLITYDSNKDQRWIVRYNAKTGEFYAEVAAANTPGMTAEQMTQVIRASGETLGNATAKVAGVVSGRRVTLPEFGAAEPASDDAGGGTATIGGATITRSTPAADPDDAGAER